MKKTFFYTLKDNTLTLYDNKGMSLADISEVYDTSYDSIVNLSEDTLYNMGYINETEKILLYPY